MNHRKRGNQYERSIKRRKNLWGEGLYPREDERAAYPQSIFGSKAGHGVRWGAFHDDSRCRGKGDEGLGGGEWRNALHTLVPAAHRHYG